jgi:prevent-host-death family protein
MARRVPLAEAKAKLSAMVDEVLHEGEHVVIQRHGRPVAALVSMQDLARLEEYRATTHPPGLLGLVGAWGDVPDEKIDAWLADVYATRALPGREVTLEP